MANLTQADLAAMIKTVARTQYDTFPVEKDQLLALLDMALRADTLEQSDTLGSMFVKQRELAATLGVMRQPIDWNNLPTLANGAVLERDGLQARDLTFWIKEMATAIIAEGQELMDWVPWKHWSKSLGNKKDKEGLVMWSEDHIDEMREEVIDLFHFVLNVCLILGMDATDVVEQYMAKNQTNFERKASGTY